MEIRDIHSILLNFEKRAENKPDDVIFKTFVDAEPLASLISAPLNQIIFGRRGTGKTHALKYSLANAREAGDAAAFLDIRSLGSNGSFYSDDSIPEVERGLKLVTDILQALHDELLSVALDRLSSSTNSNQITQRLDDFASAITEVRLTGEQSRIDEDTFETSRDVKGSADIHVSRNDLDLTISGSAGGHSANSSRSTTKIEGSETRAIDFGRTQVALSGLISILGVQRLWLFLDEWSETPREVQPYLADLIRKTILPIRGIVIKIAAIEQRSAFILHRDKGGYIGLELGADISADLNLDEFLVFDYD